MDSKQFNAQILSLSDKLYRLAKSMLRNSDAAQDAVQDLNLKLWEKRSKLTEVENMSAFTMRAMRNLCLDTLRQQKKDDDLPAEIEIKELNPHQRTEQQDLVKRVKRLIDQLPEIQRTVIRLRDVEGMELCEIAEVMSMTENAVNVNLSRARQRIRERILNEHQKVEEKIYG